MSKTLVLERPVIGITGSAGKTTTKEMIAAILKTKWNILKSIDNMNFFNHTMRYAKQVTPAHKALVLEYGMSGKGQIRRHCNVIQPNISLITNIGTAHIGAFGGDVKKLAAAKSEIIQHMNQTGLFIKNADDPNSKYLLTQGFKGRIKTVGIHANADYRARRVQFGRYGMLFQVSLHGKSQQFSIPIFGVHHVYNALFAIAVADSLGFAPEQMRQGLRNYMRLNRRLSVKRLNNGARVIDDSYSANPNATKAALDVLETIGKGTNVAVLGSMLGLGSYTLQAHRDVGRHVAKKRIHRLYTFGQFAKRIGEQAKQSGFPAERIRHFTSKPALKQHLKTLLKPGTTVLIKGSHAIGMTEVADSLVRQSRAVKRRP